MNVDGFKGHSSWVSISISQDLLALICILYKYSQKRTWYWYVAFYIGIKQKSYEKRNPRQAFSRKSLIFFVDSSSTGSISSALECGMISSYISLELKSTYYKYLQKGILLNDIGGFHLYLFLFKLPFIYISI